MRFSLLICSGVVVVVSSFGCGSGDIGKACVASTDCAAGEVCSDGRCAEPTDAAVHDSGGADVGTDFGGLPRCGDGMIRPGEQCDDGNTNPGDGCDASCAMEPNFVCPMPGSPCTSTIVCGDGVVGAGETCDDHNAAPGDGCDAHCSVEAGWACPSVGLPCVADGCGDDIVAGTEDCEDGDDPPAGGDGCDASCHFEDGYACTTPGAPCVAVVCGNGTREGTEQCDDGNHDLGDGCDPFCHREPMCTDGVCVAVCGDGVLLPGEACDDGNLRDGDGCDHLCATETGFTCTTSGATEPASVDIPIVYRDFMGNDLAGGHVDFENANATDRGIVEAMLDAMGKPAYAHVGATTVTTHGEGPFMQWYRDTTGVNMTYVERLSLGMTAPGTYVYDNGTFFPLDGRGFVGTGAEPARVGGHNFSFTSELRYWFTYAGDENLAFRGDDDVWVFINRRLALDIGGVHGAQSMAITLDAAAATTLGLTVGGIYEACVFQAERHTSASSYQLTLRGFNAVRSECMSTCGDGIVTRYEICDDGVNDGTYGHCAPGCLAWGPRCGDAMVQTDHGEECDDGRNLGGYDQCNPGCLLGPRCGDFTTQPEFGEMCDDGNTASGDGCDGHCQRELM